MKEERILISKIVDNQLPFYVKEEFPLVSQFLSQYYISQEFKGSAADLIQNIDNYIKLDESTNIVEFVSLLDDISIFDDVIFIDLNQTPSGTTGFPDTYGLLKINNEIITYTGKTYNSFTGCIRGFSGISSYNGEQAIFTKTRASIHNSGSEIINLSSLFLKEFLLKIKHQLVPGFEDRQFFDGLNQSLFIKQSKDFYRSKGTDSSFKILFKSLYGEDVSIIKPREQLFRPSDSHYQIVRDLVAESIEGNPEDLVNTTLFQNEYPGYNRTYAPITKVEKIISKDGKIFYKLSIDSNYNRDIIVDGALYGDFKIHPQTRVIGDYNLNSDTIDVDSTVGFPSSGELYVTYNDNTTGIVYYKSKNINQFFDCSNIQGTIDDSSVVSINTFANNFDNSIKVRITSVLSDVKLSSDTYNLKTGYTCDIKTLGDQFEDVLSNNWFFNISPSYSVESISLVDDTDKTYLVTVKYNHIFKEGDKLIIKDSTGTERESTIGSIISDKSFQIKGQGDLNLNEIYIIKRKILKTNNTEILKYNSNVQNVYKDENRNKTIVASTSIPYYGGKGLKFSNPEITFSGTFSSDIFKITDFFDHGLYTGDPIYYTPQKQIVQRIDDNGIITEDTVIISQLFEEGVYFVYRVNQNEIKLSLSKSDIYNSNFISIDSPTTVVSNKITPYKLRDKKIDSQNLLREISSPVNDGGIYSTNPGFTGILINGVEILNYKSNDYIYYGSLEGIEVTSSGENYDVISPPIISIQDEVGTGSSAYCSVKGQLKEIRIIDPGFDYLETPSIKITGGNGTGAKAYANMKLIDYEIDFNSESSSELVSIENNIIGFATYHRFRNGEKVIYLTNNQKSIGGLSSDSSYYVSSQNPVEIKLHKTFGDSVAGINTVQLISFGVGNHSFKSFDKKMVLGSINVADPGTGYENKKRTIFSTPSSINISTNIITILNHGYQHGDIIKYTTNGSEIGGLTNNNEYYINLIDKDRFKLSPIGTEENSKDFYFRTKQTIDLTSIGSGIHTFNYPEIVVEVIGNVGGDIKFKSSIQPIFRGEITSVYLESGGVGYGSSEILNYNRSPSVRILSGSNSEAIPIISDGKIKKVLIKTNGSRYNSPPDIKVIGNGSGCVLTPIIENGMLIEVKVIESGIGYDSNQTKIEITPAGRFASFLPKIQTWNINLFKKLLPTIKEDDGVLVDGLNENRGLQFSHLYAPRKLRELVYSKDYFGNTLYSKKDLQKVSNKEINSTSHSPIIGWAYDGNPIYGPYGYVTKKGGAISQMKSGYRIDLKKNRPPLSIFPEGFFVEDYSHFQSSDDAVLDEKNGRFCVTPEFPKGTYAYFSTINDGTADTSGTFSGYKSPEFPYLIGNEFKSRPNNFNFKSSSNQDNYDLNKTNWLRNTSPYNLNETDLLYEYLEFPNLLNQTVKIKHASSGNIENIQVISGGDGYKVGDSLIFSSSNFAQIPSAEVELIGGKIVDSIESSSLTIANFEFYPNKNNTLLAISETPHTFDNNDIVTISGISTTSLLLNDFYTCNVKYNTLSLIKTIENSSITGLVTYFSVNGNLNYPNIIENDIYQIEDEKIKILNIDRKSSRIKVLREIDSTVGTSHSSTSILYEIPRKIIINSKIDNQYQYKINKEIYFNPLESIGIGTISGVGIGSTIVFSNPGVGITEIFIPTQSIYIQNHELLTGDQLIYNSNGGIPIGVSTDGISNSVTINDGQVLYVAKLSNDLIGLSTFRVGLNTEGNFTGLTSNTNNFGLLYFTEHGSGDYHSLKTTYNSITGDITRTTVIVSTSQSHGLLNNDVVFIDVNPSIASTVTIKYNDYHKKMVVNPKDFTALDVNTTNNTISINNHGFNSGQKVIYTSSNPSSGLENNKEYYIFVIDKNNLKLTNNYFNSTSLYPSFVQIGSPSNGTLSLVNPPLEVYKNSSIIFDLSDPSLSYTNQSTLYSAFDFKIFKDNNLTDTYETNFDGNKFNLSKYGRIGITNDAKIILDINENTPDSLYYNLIPVYDGNLPESKKNNIDIDVISNNKISIKPSNYNGNYFVKSTSNKSFLYTTGRNLEEEFYSSRYSIIKYNTNSKSAKGPISKVRITDRGKNYYTIPAILGVKSSEGIGAVLESSSKSIGKIISTRINDIGFNFPSDFTIRPTLSIPKIIKINPLFSLDSIEVSSFGKGYVSAPKLLLIDGNTGKVSEDADIRLTLGNKKVDILNNTFSLNSENTYILPIQNSNGVGISSISYNSFTKEVTVSLSVGFSTVGSFPFSVNDKVLIENVNIDSVIGGRGYNSNNYNYQLFTVTAVDENIGGFGSVTYSLSNIIGDLEVPGVFDPDNSSGRIIAEKDFPKFDIKLSKNDYYLNENIVTETISGAVEDWDSDLNVIKILSKKIPSIGETIKGISSKTEGIITEVISFDSLINLNSAAKFESGWESNAGVLNDNIQRIQDSFYYQNFSYSIKSKVDYDKWNDVVSTLNHTLGFKKFSDYQLESKFDQNISNNLTPSIPNDGTDVRLINDIVGVVDLNCVYDFDFVTENNINIGGEIFSDEIVFSNRILIDYLESVGNRVLTIDDISPQFNSNPRSTPFSEVFRFDLDKVASQKYIVYVTDRRYFNDNQLLIITTLVDEDLNSFINQYARSESSYDMGTFDLSIDGSEGVLYFYPVNYKINDFSLSIFSYNIGNYFTGIATTSLGGIVDIQSNSSSVSLNNKTIVQIPNTYRSAKVLVNILSNDGKQEFDEITVVHDGSNVNMLEYGQLTNIFTDSLSSSVGTYDSYISGSNLNIDFIPNGDSSATVNSVCVLFKDQPESGISTYVMNHAYIESRFTQIASSPSPSSTTIFEYSKPYGAAYLIVQISDITNSNYQTSEIVILTTENDANITEYGIVQTSAISLGEFSVENISGFISLSFIPIENIDVNITVYSNVLQAVDAENEYFELSSSRIESGYGLYVGTENDVKRSFDLFHKNYPIFERYFDGSDIDIVDIDDDFVSIPNHFFVGGELVEYYSGDVSTVNSIGIANTSIPGIGTTDKLPNKLYIVKLDDNRIKFAATAEDSLSIIPKTLDITTVGIGTTHKITSTNQNAKVLISIDNAIQSPVVSTSITSSLDKKAFSIDDQLFFTNVDSFFGSDLIKIEDEIMRVESVGVGSTNAIRVRRPLMGTKSYEYSAGSLVTKIGGNYNIINNTINFAAAPYGDTLISSPTNSPDEKDWQNISTRSSFQGRSFIRSGIINSSQETYSKNYIFDDISHEFNGITTSFQVESNGTNVSDVADKNAIILVNGVFQSPGNNNSYFLSESLGITSITFISNNDESSYDVNVSNCPRGGIIVSVGSTTGLGYQPLVSAGGTAIVSISGTISSVSIGNSGSGYRQGAQIVNVGVSTSSTGSPIIENIGTAVVSNGHVVSVTITNPGSGYTTSNPPEVIFDAPLSYSNIPLIYSSDYSGIGTGAKVDIVVGQGSSVIDFEIKNTGYAYKNNEILTIPVGGSIGIPTTGNEFREFQIYIESVEKDQFGGWTIGELQVLDKLDSKFNGRTKSFKLSLNNDLISIRASKGSKISVQDTLLVFINDILQEPGKSYTFTGGTILRFSEPPKPGDTSNILFYRGSSEIDVIDVNILETLKPGDQVTINYDPSIGQSPTLQQSERTVISVDSTDLITTNPYFGPGNIQDEDLERPLNWCRQTEDKIINGIEIGKDRIIYEPIINPTSYVINSVGIGSTIVYVDSIRPFFNQINENPNTLKYQKKVTFVPQSNKVGASAVAIVSDDGTISDIQITDSGVGYIDSPNVVIQNSVGIGTTLAINCIATANISSGSVISIEITDPGIGYTNTNPPIVLIEPPSTSTEINEVEVYEGDFGVISGISTGFVGLGLTSINFDFYIPNNSFLRDGTITGITTLSGIQTGHYFVIHDSNVGDGVVSLDLDGNVIGSGTSFIDNVYQANSVSIASTFVVGVGVTYVIRVSSIVENHDGVVGISTENLFGKYSWGKVLLKSRSKLESYPAYTMNGFSGISTGTILKRTNPLKFSNYIS